MGAERGTDTEWIQGLIEWMGQRQAVVAVAVASGLAGLAPADVDAGASWLAGWLSTGWPVLADAPQLVTFWHVMCCSALLSALLFFCSLPAARSVLNRAPSSLPSHRESHVSPRQYNWIPANPEAPISGDSAPQSDTSTSHTSHTMLE
ncbi:hypothetical protein PG995_007662 [Apiospora arundinis]